MVGVGLCILTLSAKKNRSENEAGFIALSSESVSTSWILSSGSRRGFRRPSSMSPPSVVFMAGLLSVSSSRCRAISLYNRARCTSSTKCRPPRTARVSVVGTQPVFETNNLSLEAGARDLRLLSGHNSMLCCVII